jgi:hypothetical protein
MAHKIDDIVQVKLRIPERVRRQVLAAANKSGRSLNTELNRLIGLGLTVDEGSITPEQNEVIKNKVLATVSPLIQMFSGFLASGLKSTPEGREMLKTTLASLSEQRRAEVKALLASDPGRAMEEIESLVPFLQSIKGETRGK